MIYFLVYAKITVECDDKVQIVGDDLLATNTTVSFPKVNLKFCEGQNRNFKRFNDP